MSIPVHLKLPYNITSYTGELQTDIVLAIVLVKSYISFVTGISIIC